MRRLILVLIPVLILGSLLAWRMTTKRAAQAQLQQQRVARSTAAPKVSLAPVEIRDITNVFTSTGTLESPLTVKISPKVTGRIILLQVHEGDRVRKGQVLVRVDNSQVLAQVRQAQAALAEAQFRLAQAQYTQGPTNAQVTTNILQQKATVASARADYEQTRQNYAATVAASEAAVTDAAGRIENAQGSMNNSQAAINSALANLNDAKIKYDRVFALYKDGFVAAQDVDDAKATVLVQQAAVAAAQSQLRSATAARGSAEAQKKAAENQLSITKVKGQADVEAARQKLLQMQAALENAVANKPQIPAYQQSLKALRATVAVNQASVAAARAQLSDTVLTSPLDGYVTGRFMDPGAVATAGQQILEVRFFGNVWVNVSVPSEVAGKLATGQTITVVFDGLPGRTFTATIVQLNPSADPQAHQFTVRAALSNPTGELKPGMFGNASIVTARSPHAVAVPREALQTGDTGPYVIVVGADKLAHFTPVVTGLADGNYTSITSGLAAGENVVVLTSAPVKDGGKVDTGGAAGGAPGAAAAGGPGGQTQGAPAAQPQGAPAGQAPAAPPSGQPKAPAGAGSKSSGY